MKRTIKLLALAAAMAVFAVSTEAQKQECTEENKNAWYKTFTITAKALKSSRKRLTTTANIYIESCPDDPNDAQLKPLKKFVAAYKVMLDQRKAAEDFKRPLTTRITQSRCVLASSFSQLSLTMSMST